MGIIVVMIALIGPAMNALSNAGGATKTFYDISGLLEQARTFAQTNNTYTFIGFAEMDASRPENGPQKAGVGRLYTATVASRDGTRGYDPYDSSADIQMKWKNDYNKGARLISVAPLRSYENFHIVDLIPLPSSGPMANRALLNSPTYDAFRVGNTKFISITPFNWPLGADLSPGSSGARQIYFSKVFMFDPFGIARTAGAGTDVSQWFEIDLQPTHGNILPPVITSATAATGNYCAIMIDGLTGAVSVHRP